MAIYKFVAFLQNIFVKLSIIVLQSPEALTSGDSLAALFCTTFALRKFVFL